MSYQLLLGVGDEVLANSLRAQLSELPDMQVNSSETSSGDVVGALADEPGIEVMLLHEGLGPLPTFQLIKDISLRHPQLAVVLVADEPTPETFSAAMEAGARGVLSAQPSLEELESRISTAAEWSRSMRRHLDPSLSGGPLPGKGGMLFALAGAKGGTGATTLAVHLALAASAARHTACLVDMDLQAGDVPGYMDLTHRRSIGDLVDVAEDINATVLSDALFVHPAGPHVLLAPQDGERGEDVTARVARQVLGALRSRYEVVIVDCGAHMSEASAMAVEMADRVVIAATPDMPALRSARRLARLWTRLQVRKEDEIGVLLTQTSRHSEIQPDFARKVLQLPTLRTTVPATFRGLEQAANTGRPMDIDDDGFRRALGSLAAEIGVLEVDASTEAAASQGSSSGRRKKRRGKDEGQTAVEFVGLVPSILFVLLLLWQVVILGVTFISVGHAANEGASEAAILPEYLSAEETHDKVADAAKERMPFGWDEEATVEYKPEKSDPDYVSVWIAAPTVIPGVSVDTWHVESKARVVHEE